LKKAIKRVGSTASRMRSSGGTSSGALHSSVTRRFERRAWSALSSTLRAVVPMIRDRFRACTSVRQKA
jgi:hypothetical protein